LFGYGGAHRSPQKKDHLGLDRRIRAPARLNDRPGRRVGASVAPSHAHPHAVSNYATDVTRDGGNIGGRNIGGIGDRDHPGVRVGVGPGHIRAAAARSQRA
jgi:hypothetical protein